MMKPQRPPLTRLKFIEPMYARLVNELPEGEEWPTKLSSVAIVVLQVGILRDNQVTTI
jgi:hypothetical protein